MMINILPSNLVKDIGDEMIKNLTKEGKKLLEKKVAKDINTKAKEKTNKNSRNIVFSKQ